MWVIRAVCALRAYMYALCVSSAKDNARLCWGSFCATCIHFHSLQSGLEVGYRGPVNRGTAWGDSSTVKHLK